MVQREITIWCVVLFITLLGCSCANIHNKYSDADMIRMAEEYREHLQKQAITSDALASIHQAQRTAHPLRLTFSHPCLKMNVFLKILC